MATEITSGAVVYRRTATGIEYLLLQSQNPGHFWGFPKGHVEVGEDLVTAATREIREETSLHLIIDPSFQVTTSYDLPNGNLKEMTLYTAPVPTNSELNLQTEEIANAGWFNYQAARQRLTYDNLKSLLDQVNQHLVELGK
ncbi:NUDIX domain-containing protein [Limosilactobacillus gastricus]|uniref:Bis(5'-nucleosyl)-tetraphosphatase [asymmetrical] n=1 Tax=Limosilactobacillus gastricus DSM 16045 TaxID=1423749 RepID=A0A0R1VCW3_9LACO|nr:NUDIX domain-containing protein [Limosilactobacillus gastricus]KRM03319.1 NUDIX hydrolase [Limosilactobacillus gastricus DSM 16045]QGF41107.1 NUDIX domain-containing protein [Limosilactobacillus gastricus]